MSDGDHYQTLGITRGATPAEVRAAFVRLAKRHHPDMAGNLPWRLDEVRIAYRCLSNANTRAAHDRILAAREHDHFVRQARIAQRLRRYDRRHPHAPPRVPRRRRWRTLLVVVAGAAIVAQLSLRLIG
jgi:DnaJ-class molecular chaperone